ncbi:hypothetical protein PG991_015885 [Apiospora marii]|uniref:Uncharacterized protein n=1 Tax=Apiospora marii TaxID=335849 RepID=A0ABR1QZY9_9PEZI
MPLFSRFDNSYAKRVTIAKQTFYCASAVAYNSCHDTQRLGADLRKNEVYSAVPGQECLRSTEIEIRTGASMIRDTNTPENVRTYGFVLANPQFQDWLAAPGLAGLGIVGSDGMGKTTVPGSVYEGVRADSPGRGICIFLGRSL